THGPTGWLVGPIELGDSLTERHGLAPHLGELREHGVFFRVAVPYGHCERAPAELIRSVRGALACPKLRADRRDHGLVVIEYRRFPADGGPERNEAEVRAIGDRLIADF